MNDRVAKVTLKYGQWIGILKHTNPVTPEVLEEAYNNGMIRKEDLVDGAYYAGACRNSDIAMWNKKDNEFIYLRTKYQSTYIDTIEHPADDKGTDFFIPITRIDIESEIQP